MDRFYQKPTAVNLSGQISDLLDPKNHRFLRIWKEHIVQIVMLFTIYILIFFQSYLPVQIMFQDMIIRIESYKNL